MEKNNIDNILDTIELTEEQAEAVIKKLNEYKEEVLKANQEAIKLYEAEIREKLEQEYGAKFEETKSLLQKVYSERLQEAIEKLRKTLKEEIKKENSKNDVIIEKIKDAILPYLEEKKYFITISEKEREIKKLQEEVEKKKGIEKFENLIKEFPEDIKEELRKECLERIVNEETAVSEFYRIFKIMKLTAKKLEEEQLNEGSPDPDPDPNPDPVFNVWKKRYSKIKKDKKLDAEAKRDIHIQEDVDEDEEEIDKIIKEVVNENKPITEGKQVEEKVYEDEEIAAAIRLRQLSGIKK